MLPENRPLDYRISTTDEDEFECDRCGNTDYRLVNYETQGEIQTYAKCLECGWQCPTVDDRQQIEPQCVECGWIQNSITLEIASVGGAG